MSADDDQSAARSIPASPRPLPPHSANQSGRGARASWARSRSDSTRSSTSHRVRFIEQQWIHQATRVQSRLRHALRKLGWWQRVLLAMASIVAAVLAIVLLVFNERIFAWLEPYADRWRALRAGWLILWVLTFLTAFPPVVGYSICLTTCGFLYGLPGWFIAASASILGSLGSFVCFRVLLSGYANRLVERDKRFAALALTLKHDGLKLLVMIRLCPLPYSLSNGAIAAFPTVQPLTYALATAIASPKLLIHVFVGGRLGALAKSGGRMEAGTKAINYLTIIVGLIFGTVVGWTIYQRTMERARELEAEGRHLPREVIGRDEEENTFQDDMERDVDVRDHVHDDDISLHTNQGHRGSYRDESGDDENHDVGQADENERDRFDLVGAIR